MPLAADPDEVRVAFVADGVAYDISVWSDMSALRAIREVAGHDRPRRGCEAGLCGTCESIVDGHPQRLCITPAPQLDGLTIETPLPRRSLWAV